MTPRCTELLRVLCPDLKIVGPVWCYGCTKLCPAALGSQRTLPPQLASRQEESRESASKQRGLVGRKQPAGQGRGVRGGLAGGVLSTGQLEGDPPAWRGRDVKPKQTE